MVRYEPVVGTPKQTACQPGTRALGLAINQVYPELHTLDGSYGCFNHRPIKGSTTWSLHAEGRALDVGWQKNEHDLAWRLACELVSHRVVYGTMRVMLDRHIWTTERRDQWYPMAATTDPHLDHMHIEQFKAAAARPATVQSEYEAALHRSR